MKETTGQRGRRDVVDGRRAGRLSSHGDAIGIAAEAADVFVDPAEGSDLIEQAVVARGVLGRLGRQLGMRKEAEDAKPVVDRDDDESAGGEALTVVSG